MAETEVMPGRDALLMKLIHVEYPNEAVRELVMKHASKFILQVARRELAGFGIALYVVGGISSIPVGELEKQQLLKSISPIIIDAICGDKEVAEKAKLSIRISIY